MRLIVSCDYCNISFFKKFNQRGKKLFHYSHYFCCREHFFLWRKEETHSFVECSYCKRKILKYKKAIEKRKHLFCSSKCQSKFYRKYPYDYRDCSCKKDYTEMSERAKKLWEDPIFRKKQIIAHTGYKMPEKQKRAIGRKSRLWNKNNPGCHTMTLEGRKQISLSRKGKPPWNLGLRISNPKFSESHARVARKAWMDLAKKIRERDRYICQECGSFGNQVHHKILWEKTYDDSPDNLVTLCRSCHMKIHIKMMQHISKDLLEKNAY